MKHERTEADDRPGMDKDKKYKGIARHPLARRWMNKVYAEARKAGDVAFACKTRDYMKVMGMEVRDEG